MDLKSPRLDHLEWVVERTKDALLRYEEIVKAVLAKESSWDRDHLSRHYNMAINVNCRRSYNQGLSSINHDWFQYRVDKTFWNLHIGSSFTGEKFPGKKEFSDEEKMAKPFSPVYATYFYNRAILDQEAVPEGTSARGNFADKVGFVPRPQSESEAKETFANAVKAAVQSTEEEMAKAKEELEAALRVAKREIWTTKQSLWNTGFDLKMAESKHRIEKLEIKSTPFCNQECDHMQGRRESDLEDLRQSIELQEKAMDETLKKFQADMDGVAMKFMDIGGKEAELARGKCWNEILTQEKAFVAQKEEQLAKEKEDFDLEKDIVERIRSEFDEQLKEMAKRQRVLKDLQENANLSTTEQEKKLKEENSELRRREESAGRRVSALQAELKLKTEEVASLRAELERKTK